MSGDIYTAGNEVCATNETTDAAPDNLILKSGDCYAQGTQTASNLYLAGGSDEKKIVVDTAAATAADTVTATCNGTALAALADGTAWVTCVGDTDAACATKVAAALDAQAGACADYVAVGDTVYAQPFSCSTYALDHAASDAAYLAANNGTDGIVLVPPGTAAAPGLAFIGDPNNGFYRSAADHFAISTNGVLRLDIASTGVDMRPMLYNSTATLSLGAACTTTHTLGTGTVCSAGALEVDGISYLDGGARLLDSYIYYAGTGNDGGFGYIVSQTPDAHAFLLGADSNALIVAELADVAYDFAHAQQADPTIWLQSHNQSATEWMSFQHNATNGVVATGAGDLSLAPAGGDTVVTGLIRTNVHTFTIADDAAGTHASGTLTPTSNLVYCDCDDAHGCTVTMGEGGASTGAIVTIVGTTATHCDFADTPGVSELAGGFEMSQDDSLTLVYNAATWVEMARSDN